MQSGESLRAVQRGYSGVLLGFKTQQSAITEQEVGKGARLKDVCRALQEVLADSTMKACARLPSLVYRLFYSATVEARATRTSVRCGS